MYKCPYCGKLVDIKWCDHCKKWLTDREADNAKI